MLPKNGLALAGMMVSLLGLVLSIIVIGGFLGLAGFVLSALGLRRARSLDGNGKAIAVGGMVVGILAIGLSILGFFWIRSFLDNGDTTVINGIRSTSADTEHPPQEDFDRIECGGSNTGLLARATVTLTNRSSRDTRYTVTVEWDTETTTTVSDTFTTDSVDIGETDSFSTIDLSGEALIETCRVVEINRRPFSFLP